MNKFLTNRQQNRHRNTSTKPRTTEQKTSKTRIREDFYKETSVLRQEIVIYYEIKQDKTIRLYLQNVRGLGMELPAKLMYTSKNIRYLQVDIRFLQEMNDSLPKHNRQKVAKALSQELKYTHLSISTLIPYHKKKTINREVISLHSPHRHNANSHPRATHSTWGGGQLPR